MSVMNLGWITILKRVEKLLGDQIVIVNVPVIYSYFRNIPGSKLGITQHLSYTASSAFKPSGCL